MEFRCRVDHIAAHTETHERTLWAAVVALEEGADSKEAVASRIAPGEARQIRERAERNRNAAASLSQIVEGLASGDPTS